MEKSSVVDRESEFAVGCLEQLIAFLGETYANVQSLSAASEQVCEDYKEAVRFLRQLPVIQLIQEQPPENVQACAYLGNETLSNAQSSLDALLIDAERVKAGLAKKDPISHHASSPSRARASESGVGPCISGQGVHAARTRHPHDLPLAPQHTTGETRHRTSVSGPAPSCGARPGRALPVAPAGPKTVSKGGSLGSKTAPPPAPRSGSLRSDCSPVGVQKAGLGTPANLAGVAKGVFARGIVGANQSGTPGGVVRFPAFEALRFPASFRTALARIHARTAENRHAGVAAETGQIVSGGHFDLNGRESGVRKEDGVGDSAVSAVGETRPVDEACENVRLAFVSRLQQLAGEYAGVETPSSVMSVKSEAPEANELAESLRSNQPSGRQHARAVFTLLRAQTEILTGLWGDVVWRATAPGDSHVARHRNRCLRALLGEHPTQREQAGSKPQPSPKPQTSAKPHCSAVNPPEPTSVTRLRTRASSLNDRLIANISNGQRQHFEGALRARQQSCEDTWLPPICWRAVEITCEDLRQSAAEVAVVPAIGGAARGITCASAKHLSSLAHLTHSVEWTVLRCYLEAVLLAPLLQLTSDRSNVTDSFLARCRLAYTLLCTEGRGSMSISYRDWQ